MEISNEFAKSKKIIRVAFHVPKLCRGPSKIHPHKI